MPPRAGCRCRLKTVPGRTGRWRSLAGTDPEESGGATPARHRARLPARRRRSLTIAAALTLAVLVLVLTWPRAGHRATLAAAPAAPSAVPVTATPAATPPAATVYPAKPRQAYLDGCAAKDANRADFCLCTLEAFEQQLGWEQFQAVATAAQAGDPAARDRYNAVALGCAARAPK
jgi:hypothetical protein